MYDMKTKKIYLIERIICILINVMFLPIAIIAALLHTLLCGFDFCLKQRNTFLTFISHKLFLCCDEKDVVKNQTIYEHMTVKALYQFLGKK